MTDRSGDSGTFILQDQSAGLLKGLVHSNCLPRNGRMQQADGVGTSFIFLPECSTAEFLEAVSPYPQLHSLCRE